MSQATVSDHLTSPKPEIKRAAQPPALILALACALISLDITIVVVALPTIGDALGFGIAGYAWVMDAYSLTFSGLLLAAGAIADRYGRRRSLIAGTILFGLASAACGLALDGPMLWIARAVQGAGAAGVITGSLALLSNRYSEPAERARAFALVGTLSGVAMAFGPTFGGVATALLGWRWIFLVNLPLCVIVVWAVRRFLAESKETVPRPLDPVGIFLLTLSLGACVKTLLHDGGTLPNWIWLGGGACVFGTFIAQQLSRPVPLLDSSLFRQTAFLGMSVSLIAMSFGYWATLVYLPLLMQHLFGLAPETAGVAMLLATLPMLLLPSLGGRLATRLQRARFFGIGLLGVTIGDGFLALSATESAKMLPWIAPLGMILAGSGTGLISSQVSGAMVALAPPSQAGMASAIQTLSRQAGFAVGIALFGAILNGSQGLQSVGMQGFVWAFLAAGVLPALMAVLYLFRSFRR